TAGTPVHHVLAAVNEVFLIELDEDLADGGGETGVESESFAAPIAARAEADHLAFDVIAVFGFPLPDALFEFFAAEIAIVDAFFGKLASHHHLGSDAGVIGARKP